MREIKFRGLYNNEWVYGTYHYSADKKHHYILAREKLLVHDGGYMALHDKEVWEVEPDTIGQFSGIKDKLGKEIYEGDIVKTHYGTIDKITWDELAWNMAAGAASNPNGKCTPLAEKIFNGIEIIGNIYHNPELLEC